MDAQRLPSPSASADGGAAVTVVLWSFGRLVRRRRRVDGFADVVVRTTASSSKNPATSPSIEEDSVVVEGALVVEGTVVVVLLATAG